VSYSFVQRDLQNCRVNRASVVDETKHCRGRACRGRYLEVQRDDFPSLNSRLLHPSALHNAANGELFFHELNSIAYCFGTRILVMWLPPHGSCILQLIAEQSCSSTIPDRHIIHRASPRQMRPVEPTSAELFAENSNEAFG